MCTVLRWTCCSTSMESFFFNSFIFGCTGSSLPRGLFLVAVSRGCSLVEVLGLLIVVASLVAEHGL